MVDKMPEKEDGIGTASLPTFVTLCSGSGSNFKAILNAVTSGEVLATPLAVISNNPTAYALEIGKDYGVEAVLLDQGSKEIRDKSLRKHISRLKPDFILLSGYLKMVPLSIIDEYSGRILNIHPSLLPNHGGKGMYGIRVHQSVIANKDLKSGATIHLVTAEYDKGPVILQATLDVAGNETPETLAKRVLELEHVLYPQAINIFLKNNSF